MQTQVERYYRDVGTFEREAAARFPRS